MQHFDFSKMKSFNPMEKVKTFFVSPYQPSNAQLLGLESKVNKDQEFKAGFYRGMPVVVFPISVLQLGKACIHWKEEEAGIIIKGSQRIYFRISGECLRIDTVLN